MGDRAGQLASWCGRLWLAALAAQFTPVAGATTLSAAAVLTSSAAMASIGPVAVVVLAGLGLPAATAVAAVLVFASSDSASPIGPPVYIASTIAGIEPARTFRFLLGWYMLPTLPIGAAIALGVLPI